MQFIQILEQSYNLIYSFCVLIAIALWLLSSLGIFGGNDDAATLSPAHLPTELPTSYIDAVAETLGVGSVPSSILSTLFLFFIGSAGIVLNESLLFLVIPQTFSYYTLLVSNFFVSIGIGFGLTSLSSRPLRYLFKDYGKAITAESLVGKVAKISSGKANQQSGQANIQLADGNIVEIAVRVIEDNKTIEYGTNVLLIDFDKEKNIYWVQILETNH
jgi:hypothetical protein